MPAYTCGKTADNIKKKIKQYDKFILVATDGAIASKWCNWELGYGDAQKYDNEKIALFPLKQDDHTNWKGSEYLELYPVIEYINGYCRREGLVKTEDIHPPKTGISVHFCVLSLMAMQK